MSQAKAKRTSLLIGCGSAALALGLVLGGTPAQAQGIQADGTVTFGVAQINQTVPNETTVEVFTNTTVIDWNPREDAAGNALDFLPSGAFAFFNNNANSQVQGNYAVLNRILPSTNGNVAVINGTVISQIFQANGASSIGGFVAFYSPTGILVGSSASFDVGQLLLTTLDVSTNESFRDFSEFGAPLELVGAQGSTARIRIQPGAQILATPENAFFAVVAADVEMLGLARVNGSHVYVAGEAVNLTFDNGLFNIEVPVGTAASGEVMTLDGSIGGPTSQGVGDNHMIYAVARASQDPISMLFRGNLGFDPAQSAGVINGEIILAANYDVSGRNVDGGSIRDGINATFNNNSELTDVRADIDITDATVTGSMLAIGTHRVTAASVGADSSFAGNLLLVGRESATLSNLNGNDLVVTGDVLVDARDYGASGSFLQAIDVANATGGAALIESVGGGTLTVSGSAQVRADAIAGADTGAKIAGFARAGSAAISGDGGIIDIKGSALISARGLGSTLPDFVTGAESRGGTAEARARAGGSVAIGLSVDILADAIAAQGTLSNDSTLSNAYGGNARIAVRDGGGTITVGTAALLDASAVGGSATASGTGSVGDAGEATVSILESGLITLGGGLQLTAAGVGGANAGGTGGRGLGGRASVVTEGGGTIEITGDFAADASGAGGGGQTGGNGLAGLAGANARIGLISIDGNATILANGLGGSAEFEFGGDGGFGQGGNAFLQAEGTQSETGTLTITGSAILFAEGLGGVGGATDGQSIGPGRGGNGFGAESGLPNQADNAVNGGIFVLAGRDNGRLTVNGVTASGSGIGGFGGTGGGIFTGGEGGTGFGGLVQLGLAQFGQSGSLGAGQASLGAVDVNADGFGGRSGFSGPDIASGNGGEGVGGLAVMSLRAGDVVASTIRLAANGTGGAGATAGDGRGGETQVVGSDGGTLVASNLSMRANGTGGDSPLGTGGTGRGGTSSIVGNGVSVTINGNVLVEASGNGGSSDDGAGGEGRGGSAFVATTSSTVAGAVNITGHASIFANGRGGSSVTAFAAGNGQGGFASVEAIGSSGGTISLGSVQMAAIGRGGVAAIHEGGDGTGGTVQLRAIGSSNTLTVQRNVPAAASAVSPAGFAMLSAEGIGTLTTGGDGIGGRGQGGSVLVSAVQGATVNLPVNILADPLRAADSLFMVARGLGGDSGVDGGTGGAARGGDVSLRVDGGTLVAGAVTLSTLSRAGGSADPLLNITGGDATGGARTISVVNNGTLTLQSVGGALGAEGGNGSGTGNGGNATGDTVLFEVLDSVANLAGPVNLTVIANGGNGQRGGNATGATTTVNANNATIAFSGGSAALLVDSAVTGGEGTQTGGDATGNAVNMTLNATSLTGGRLSVVQTTVGGLATNANGAGGNATGQVVQVTADGSTLSLVGPLTISASASGGDGGANGTGGTAQAGEASLTLTNTGLTLAVGAQGAPADIAVLADGDGGFGGTVGNGSGGPATLAATGGSINIGQLLVSAQGRAFGLSGQVGGAASGGVAQLKLDGPATLDASTITVIGSAVTGIGGTSSGGIARFDVSAGSDVDVNATTLLMFADASGADPAALANEAGAFIIDIGGGNINLGRLNATAIGDVLEPDPVFSRIIADGGNVNVTGDLTGFAFGDILVGYGAGGIIGSTGTGPTATAVQFDSRGTLTIQGDGGATGGVGGRSINMFASRSILVNGNLTATDGGIGLTANLGGAQALAQPDLSVITMAQGTRINGGTGNVTISLVDGGSDPQRQTGAITLANISAASIDVRNFGTTAGSDIGIISDGVLTASGTGRAIDLASLNGEVINLHGDAGLILTGGGHYGIFAATPTGSQIGSFANYVRRYNVLTETAYDALNPGGNFAAFRITPVLNVTADNATRFYGSANAGFTASFAGFLPGDSIADLTGALQFLTSADGTSPIGQYALNVAQGTLVSAQGYQFTFAPGILNVTPRPITITASNLSRVYGNANPALTFVVGGQGLVNGDQLGGALATTAGLTSGIGNYAITQGTLVASNNYAVTFVGGQLTVDPRPITITASDFSRIYGNGNPALTFVVGGQGLVNGDQLTGALTTAAGVTTGIGNYAITQGTLAASANYAVTYNAGILSITPRPIIIDADSFTRIYGNANPALTYVVGGQGLVNGDLLTGTLATTAGPASGIGTYAITQGTLTAGANYALTYNAGILSITPRPITITASNLSRIYGDANPALTFTVGGQGLVNGDQLAGALATTAGPATGIGNYAITQGTLAAGANYTVTYISGILAVTPRPITVTASNLSRVYGNANPALTFVVGGQGLVNGDQLTGALATTAGLTTGIGNYGITQGTLAASANYTLTYNAGTLAITPRPITITADSFSRIYGNANPALTFSVGGLGLVNGDQLTGALATNAGVTTGVGTAAITQGTLAASANYAVTYNPGVLTITPRPLTITAGSFSRVYGNANPTLTFTLGGQGLVNGDQLTGALAAAGVTAGVGTSAITIGTLTAGANYAVTFTPGVLTITPRPLTVAANNQSKTLGLADPLLTFLLTSGDLVNGDQLRGSLVRDPGETIGTFVIRQGTLSAGDNYALTYVPGTFTINTPPVSPDINNPTRLGPPLVIGAMPPPPIRGEANGLFGIDFPERPEAALISEDPLVDDPVASGGDSSVYGGGAAAPAGDK